MRSSVGLGEDTCLHIYGLGSNFMLRLKQAIKTILEFITFFFLVN